VYLRLEHEAFGVYEQVGLSAFDLLATIITSLFSAHPGGLDRLGVHYSSAGFGISPASSAQAFADRAVHPLPSAVNAPDPEVVKDGLPRWEVVRQEAPRTAAPQDVEDGVEYLTEAMGLRSPSGFLNGNMRLQAGPFGIGEIGGVRFSHAC